MKIRMLKNEYCLCFVLTFRSSSSSSQTEGVAALLTNFEFEYIYVEEMYLPILYPSCIRNSTRNWYQLGSFVTLVLNLEDNVTTWHTAKIKITINYFVGLQGAFLWENPKTDHWSKITWITVHQRNRWIHSGKGVFGSSDAPWSK